MKTTNRNHILFRYVLITTGILVFALCIVVKMFDTTVISADKWNAKAMKELTRVETIRPDRGNILAADGSVLATNLRYYTVRLDFRSERFMKDRYINALDSLSDSLALYFPIRTAKQWKKYLHEPITRERLPRAFRVIKNISYADYLKLRTFPFFNIKNRNRNGLVCESYMLRKLPYGAMARRSIGGVGEDSVTGEVHGISGLEKALDSMLYGRPGVTKKIPLTKNIVDWEDVPAIPGYDIHTTIDIKLQDIVETELNNMLALCGADWATAVLMDVKTGDIKAISNLEKSDRPGVFIEGMNRAVLGYEPGSVVKTLSMLIALEDGYVRDTSRVISTGSAYAYAGGRPITDAHGVGSMKISEVLERSSNIGMTKVTEMGYNYNPVGFRQRIAETGFFEPMHTGIAGETTPRYPELKNNRGGRIAMSRMCYGYSTEISPLSMLSIYNAIANGGRYVRPRLVKGLSGNGTDTVFPVTYIRERICSEENAAILRVMLRKVVWGSHGTGRLLRNKKVEIAGKTGTCYVTENGHYNTAKRRLAFVGFFPAKNPQYSCVVLTCNPKNPRGAASTSGTVLKNIALSMYARGMLNNSSDYRNHKDPVSVPTLYATQNVKEQRDMLMDLSLRELKRFAMPESDSVGVPNVVGLGAREAVAVMESAGINVNIAGSGYVRAQSPVAGSPITPGGSVLLTLVEQ